MQDTVEEKNNLMANVKLFGNFMMPQVSFCKSLSASVSEQPEIHMHPQSDLNRFLGF